MENRLPTRHNWWLVGISCFTTVLFGIQTIIAYKSYVFRGDVYYIISLVVYGALTLFSIFAAVQGWRNALPGQRRLAAEEQPAEAEHPTDEP